MKLIIVRGPSGTGKTTIAQHLGKTASPHVVVPTHEADKFFLNPVAFDDEYKFSPHLLGAAHRYCQLGVERDMFHKVPLVIVSNTSTRTKEIEPYNELAKKYGYDVDVIRTPGPWDPALMAKRNRHNVPAETIKKQLDRYSEWPGEVEWSDMSIFE